MTKEDKKNKIIYCFKEYTRILASIYRDYYLFTILNFMHNQEDEKKYYDVLNKSPNLVRIRDVANFPNLPKSIFDYNFYMFNPFGVVLWWWR